MPSLHFSVAIHAPKARVHQLMLADQTYREWTSAFAEGSSYQGSWDKGAKILFGDGQGSGMSARIAEHRPAEIVSIEMLSEVKNGVPEKEQQWHDVFENYTFTETKGVTTLQVDITDMPDEYVDFMTESWRNALDKLKAICERNRPEDIMASLDPKLDLAFERIVAVQKELIWKAWTTPVHLMPWFCPLPWKTIACEIDLRPGGRFYTVMQSPEGQQFPNEGCYLEVIENERLTWTNALLPGFRPVAGVSQPEASVDFKFSATIQLESNAQGTRYRAIARHADEAGRNQHAAMGFEQGWGAALDQLIAYAKKM